MSDIIIFAAQLKSMSEDILQLGIMAHSVFTGIEEDIYDTQKALQVFDDDIINIRQDLEQLVKPLVLQIDSKAVDEAIYHTRMTLEDLVMDIRIFDDGIHNAQHDLEQLARPVALQIDNSAFNNGIDRARKALNSLGHDIRISVDVARNGSGEAPAKPQEKISKYLDLPKFTPVGMAKWGAGIAADQVQSLVTQGMKASKTEAEIKEMAGEDAGSKLYKTTGTYIRAGMFGTDIFEQEKMLLGKGEKAVNLPADLRQLADISNGDKQHLATIAHVLGETIANGKYTAAQQATSLSVGFNPLKELSRSTGESVKSLTDKMAQGTFTTEMFRKSMESATGMGGGFYKNAEKNAQTPWGQAETIKSKVELAQEEMGKKLMPVWNDFLTSLQPIIDKLPALLEKLIPVIDGIIRKGTDLLTWVANNTDTVKSAAYVMKDILEIWIALRARSLAIATASAFSSGLAGTAAGSAGAVAAAEGTGMVAAAEGTAAVAGGVGLVAAEGVAISLLGSVAVVAAVAGLGMYLLNKYSSKSGPLKMKSGGGFYDSEPILTSFKQVTDSSVYNLKPDGKGGIEKVYFKKQFVVDTPAATKPKYMTREFEQWVDKSLKEQDQQKKQLEQKKQEQDQQNSHAGKKENNNIHHLTEAIVGGGQKVVNINMNAPMYKVEKQVFENIKDAISDFEPKVQEALWRILRTVPG